MPRKKEKEKIVYKVKIKHSKIRICERCLRRYIETPRYVWPKRKVQRVCLMCYRWLEKQGKIWYNKEEVSLKFYMDEQAKIQQAREQQVKACPVDPAEAAQCDSCQ